MGIIEKYVLPRITNSVVYGINLFIFLFQFTGYCCERRCAQTHGVIAGPEASDEEGKRYK
jgi:hypothetical protein